MRKNEFLPKVDLTLLDADAGPEDFTGMAREACELGSRSVCVPMGAIELAGIEINRWVYSNPMRPHITKICSVIDFPDGNMDSRDRFVLLRHAFVRGSNECDIVIPIGRFLAGNFSDIANEFSSFADMAEDYNRKIKVIVETGYLSDEQILKSAELCRKYGFIWKTSTGREPKVEMEEKARHVRLVREAFPGLNIKAAGGIRTQEDVEMLNEAGANIFGISWKAAKEIAANWK